MKYLKEDLHNILEKQRIRPVFQPIVSLRTGEVIGYEALSRIVNPREIHNTEELFDLACMFGQIWDLEQLCRSKILEQFHLLYNKKSKEKLFLNVNPRVIHDQQFHVGFTSHYLEQYQLNPDCIIFEMTEKSAVDDVRGFKDTIRHYKSQGYEIAIDDVGSCYSGLNLICDIIPHYLKLDNALIHNIHKDTIKYAMVKSLVEFANLTNIQLIAEGIECEAELKTLLRLGVHNGQGYFLRRPGEELKDPEKKALELIQKHQLRSAVKFDHTNCGEFHVVLFKFSNYKAFRAYCGKYGDKKGDAMMGMLKEVIAETLNDTETMAMLDSDTVAAIIEKKNYRITCETVINMFRNRLQSYYLTEDWKQGYMEAPGKHKETKKYPIIDICSERIV